MRSSIALLITTVAASVGAMPAVRATSTGEVVAYWGNGSGRDLKDYCSSGSGIDILVLSFLSQYGDNHPPSGGFNEKSSYCNINSDGSGSCPALADDIKTCQANGKKIIMALGGGGAPGTLNSENDAKGVAYSLWNSYGNPEFKDAGDNSPRPFGDVFVNGFDIDVEKSDGNTYYQYMINELRSYFERDTANQYYITGAPQCPLPEDNMGTMIEHAQFDYLWVQFYNNEQNCDAAVYVYGPQYEGATFNYDAWIDYLQGTPSENAKFLVGIPASSSAAHSVSYIQPPDLPKLIDYVKAKPQFSGIMFWEASESDKYSNNNCNFAQEVRSILDTGSTC